MLGSCLVDSERLGEIRQTLQERDFYRLAHARIWRAICALNDRGAAVDLLSLRAELDREPGALDKVGGAAYLASLLDMRAPSRNVKTHAARVLSLSRRRDVALLAMNIVEAASNGVTDDRVEELVRDLAESGPAPATWRPSTLETIADESAGEVPYIADGLLPAGEVTVLGAGWKTGKTLVAYRLALDVARGAAVFGRYAVKTPAPVLVVQLEMPPSEDARRLRRLAIGAGMYPAEVPLLIESGALALYNRPPIDLMQPRGIADLHAIVRKHNAGLVLLDSILAAFAGADLNDNAAIRRLFTAVFSPLTSEGRAVLALHHKRKKVSGARADEDDRHALLGAQAFGAAAGRVYSLERLLGQDDTAQAQPGHAPKDRAFKCRLSLTGSWTPEESPDVVLSVRDTADGGTAVLALDERAEIAEGGVTGKQRAAIALAQLVRLRRRIARADALTVVAEESNRSKRTVAEALGYAIARGWVAVVPSDSEGGARAGKDLVPGSAEDDL